MSLTAAAIVFSIAWWVCFLAVLPIGVRGQWEDDSTVPGTDNGAPAAPMVAKKAIWATGLAVIVTAFAAIAVPLVLAQ